MEFNCSGNSDYYIDLNCVRLLSRIKLVKTDGSDLPSGEINTVGSVNTLLHSMFSSLSVSLNDKTITLRDKPSLQGVPRNAFKLCFLCLWHASSFKFLVPLFAYQRWSTER